MGKRSDRWRRTERQARAPAARGSGAPGGSGGPPGGASFGPHLVDQVIDAALAAYVGRSVHRFDDVVTVLAVGPSGPDGAALVDRALGRRLLDAVGDAWGRGWQPADLARVVEREHGRLVARLGVAAIVREARRYEPSQVPPRWRAQVDELDPGAPGPASAKADAPDDPDGSRWAVLGQGGDRPAALRVALRTLSFVARLPEVPRLGPAPGDASVSAVRAGAGSGAVDGRMLHRVRGLLAKAESTTFPDEAEALTAKAQELMARHAIDAAVVEAERGQRASVSGRRVGVDDPYAAAKAMLIDAIATANRCRSVWSKGFGYATVFGDDRDLDAVELLYTSLLVQAARAMLTDEGTAPGARRAGGRTRSFRQSFLVAFATRIGVRLRAAVDSVTESYGDQRVNLLPVLADRRDAADAACDETFPHVRATSISANDWHGWQAGNDAAEAAQLDVHAPVPKRSSA
jgi:hypothetical protein